METCFLTSILIHRCFVSQFYGLNPLLGDSSQMSFTNIFKLFFFYELIRACEWMNVRAAQFSADNPKNNNKNKDCMNAIIWHQWGLARKFHYIQNLL